MPGLAGAAERDALVEQLLESVRRVDYVRTVRGRSVSPRRADPSDELFDPLKAAIHHQRASRVEEAYWLVFLFVHFGKHSRSGWEYARHVYGRLGDPRHWNWARTSADPAGFRDWLAENRAAIEAGPGGFGNHRKYESLNARSDRGTGAAVQSYVEWVDPPRTHEELMAEAIAEVGGDPREAFRLLFRSMESVRSFGRTAKFDYLAMIGKLGLAAIEPGSAFLQGATGPVEGARLLFGRGHCTTEMDRWLIELADELDARLQVIEDALCNWQKSPNHFVPFRG
ncbi:hypothetical protein ACFL59_03680 [Planctomycetota bacterium]